MKDKIKLDRNRIVTALEIPNSVLDVFSPLTDFDFIIAPVFLKYKEYADFYSEQHKRGRYIILDNGAFEGELVSVDDLINVAHQVNPDEIVAPDVPGKFEETKRVTFEFLDRFQKHSSFGKVRVQASPQGETFEDFVKCYKLFSKDERIDVLGISYFFTPKPKFEANMPTLASCYGVGDDIEALRVYFFHHLISENLINKDKPHHLLGIKNLKGLAYYRLLPFIRSIDTSFPILCGFNNIIIDYNTKKPKQRLNYEIKFDDQQLASATINIAKLKTICENV